MSDEPTRAELEKLLHYYQNRAVDGEARLAAAEARIRGLEEALGEQGRWLFRCADEEGNLRWKNTMLNRARACRAALAPPPQPATAEEPA